MKRSDITAIPPQFSAYINRCGDIPLHKALAKYGKPLLEAERDTLAALGDRVYEPGKWTVKDIIQHITDAERIFEYRALRYARHDDTVLPAFDENLYAATAYATQRSIDDLLHEFYTVRQATISLFDSFGTPMLLREGNTRTGSISVLALGFTIAGHALHHIAILKERYYGLVG